MTIGTGEMGGYRLGGKCHLYVQCGVFHRNAGGICAPVQGRRRQIPAGDLLMEVREELAVRLQKYQETMDKLNHNISRYIEARKKGVLTWDEQYERRDF